MEGNGSAPVGPTSNRRKQELVRLVIRFLYSLGYNDSASFLENESKLSYKSSEFLTLESRILKGDWEECIKAFGEFKDIKDDETRFKALFLILQHWILECVRSNDISSALKILQRDFADLSLKKEHVHQLASLLLMEDVSGSRELLVIELEKILPLPIVVPAGRLESMAEKLLVMQSASCLYHNIFSLDELSILEDHTCGEDLIPSETVQILEGHTNEVWTVQFSNNGNYLASSSRDCTAIIWKVPERGNLTLMHTLRGHRNPVSLVSWSPNDEMVLTVGFQEDLKLWDVETGTCRRTISEHSPISNACAWFPNSKHFVFASNRPGPDKCIYMCKFNEFNFTHLTEMDIGELNDIAVLPNGETIVYIFPRDIVIQSLTDHSRHYLEEESAITSLCLSRDGTRLMVNLTNHEIHSWSVTERIKNPIKFLGHKQERFAIRSCIGGWESIFVASGSEDSQVYIWHRSNSDPIKVLPGHSMAVNSVSWNPKHCHMLASASDDCTIRIWVSPRTDKCKS